MFRPIHILQAFVTFLAILAPFFFPWEFAFVVGILAALFFPPAVLFTGALLDMLYFQGGGTVRVLPYFTFYAIIAAILAAFVQQFIKTRIIS